MTDIYLALNKDGKKVVLTVDSSEWDDVLMNQWRCHELINQLSSQWDQQAATTTPTPVPVTVNVKVNDTPIETPVVEPVQG